MANAVTALPENNSIGYEIFLKPLLNDPKVNALPFSLNYGKIGKELYFDSEFTATPTIKATCFFIIYTRTELSYINAMH